MSKDSPGPGAQDWPGAGGDLVRQQSWETDGPAELELSVDVGTLRVRLDEQAEDSVEPSGGAQEVRVEVRHDPTAGGSWSQSLSGLLNWLGGPPDGAPAPGGDLERLAADAVQATEVSWSAMGRRLVVRSPAELPLRVVPLAITVSAPARSRLAARAGSGDVRVSGVAGWTAVRTGSGEVQVAAVDGEVDVNTGSGDVELGPVSGRGRVRTGSGRVSIARVGGTTEIKASSGDITVREVAGDLGVRTGSGEVVVADAHSGRLDLTTGTGGLRIGVHPGVGAELDLSSGSGQARSDLEVRSVAPEQPVALQVRGRTGSGEVLVTRAAGPA